MSDLARRDARERLSKSFMNTACGEKAWLSIYRPRPWVAPEKVTFGTAVDAGCSAYIAMARIGDPSAIDLEVAYLAAHDAVKDEPNRPDMGEVQDAIDAFTALPFDWAFCRIGAQAGTAKAYTMRLELEGVPIPVECHPDVVLKDHSIWDIKTSNRAKPENAAETSDTELSFYGICYEAFEGVTVPEVGYLTWTRTKAPRWQMVSADFTDDMRRRAYASARRWAAAIKASSDDFNPFVFGPKWGCDDCQYHPALGGECELAQPLREVS